MKVSVAAILTALLLLSGCAKTPAPAPLATVPDVDLERYRGTWIEIARYENRFEKAVLGQVPRMFLTVTIFSLRIDVLIVRGSKAVRQTVAPTPLRGVTTLS